MSPRDSINQMLEDMDRIRPVVLAAMPDDMELRTITRRLIAGLEAIQQMPSVPMPTYLWLSQAASKLLDAEHGALLKPTPDGDIPELSRDLIKTHIEQRKILLMQALQEIPSTLMLLDRSSELIGKKARRDESLQGRARHLQRLLREHLQHDVALRGELQQLLEAFAPSLAAISSVLEQAGEDSPELSHAKQILEQELPDDVEEARALLQDARKGIVQAGNKLSSASAKLRDTIDDQVEKLSSLSSQLEQAESEARNDPLTGLANRRRLAEFLNAMGQSGFCFMVIDIDYFKKINDTYGHDVGDEILQQLAVILQESTRSSDLAARIGGEEFCIIFPSTGLPASQPLAEALRQAVAIHPFATQQGAVEITVSIGIAEHQPGTAPAITFKAADKALYQSKHDGRNRVTSA